MKTIAIPVTIAPALPSEILTKDEMPMVNTVYFFKKPDGFRGPFVLHEGSDPGELQLQLYSGLLYTISYDNPDGFHFLMNLRPANADDLKDGKSLRRGFIYYMREERDVIDGPFYLSSNTDIDLLARYLRTRTIYIISEEQSFTPYNIQHSA